MRVAVTGTPGTGKTTAVERLVAEDPDAVADLAVLHLNDLVREADLYESVDRERDSLVADLAALDERVPADALVESHLAHRLAADRVVVLRCRPDELADRLRKRGAAEGKVTENVEAERLDVILAEAVERHGEDRVFEVDTTDTDPGEVAGEVAAVVRGERDPSAGTVSYL